MLLSLGAARLSAQEPVVVVFNDGTSLEVAAVEVQEGALVLTTLQGRRQLMPRDLVNEAATERANPGLFTQAPSSDSRSESVSSSSARSGEGLAPETESASSGQEPMIDSHEADGHGGSRLSATAIPLQMEDFPQRPKPLLELGSPLLGSGPIHSGFRMPGGAVWQPSFQLFGTFRTALSTTDNEDVRTDRWANRLDLFGNIYLSQTERILFGLRPFDETNAQGGRSFTGYTSLTPDPMDLSGESDHFNFDSDTVSHLFFEGDFGEIFPMLDGNDQRALDFGFSLGRQPISFQEGLLINDSVDSLGITRNNLKTGSTVNHQLTALFAWNEINRNTGTTGNLMSNAEAESASLMGLFNEMDWRKATVNLDVIYVSGGTFTVEDDNGDTVSVEAGDAYYVGASFVRRFGGVNAAIRVLGSLPARDTPPIDDSIPLGDPTAKGWLVFTEMSWTSHGSYDFSYVNAFYAVDQYRAAALDPNLQGPLARAGILFAGSGLGDPGAISSEATNAIGGTFGRQRFFQDTRRQLILEGGLRYSMGDCIVATAACLTDTIAGGVRYQIAFGRRGVLVLDGYVALDRVSSVDDIEPTTSRTRTGGRVEFVTKF